MEKSKEKNGFFKKLIDETVKLFKNPKKLIPTFVLAGIWILFSLLSAFGVKNPIIGFLSFITFAGGGMYGGLIGAIGGIFGKALFAAFVTEVVYAVAEKKNPFSNSGKGFKALFDRSVFSGLNAISSLLLFAGIGILICLFFNVTSDPANCAISLVCIIGTVTAIGSSNGLLFTVLFKLLGIFTKGKAPSLTDVDRALTGLTAGFTLGLPVTFARLPWLTAVIGAVLIVGGIVCAAVGKKQKAKV